MADEEAAALVSADKKSKPQKVSCVASTIA